MSLNTSFFDSQAISRAEFERSEAHFSDQAASLAAFVEDEVGELMQGRLTQAVVDEWAEEADSLLRLAIGEQRIDESAAQAALAEFRASLSQRAELDEAIVSQEIKSVCLQVAGEVLTRWYGALHSAGMPEDGSGIELNANMLPGTLSTEEILNDQPIPIGEDAEALLGLAVRAYRAHLVQEAAGNVIAFAPELFVVQDHVSSAFPFRCFNAEADAQSFRDMQRQAHQHSQGSGGSEGSENQLAGVHDRLVELVQTVREATLPGVGAGRNLDVLANAADALLMQMWEHPLGNLHQHVFIAPHHEPTRFSTAKYLAGPVGIGVDVVCAGLAQDLWCARSKLSQSGPSIRNLLFQYAGARNIQVKVVLDVFAVNVAAAVECQMRQYGGAVISSATHKRDSFEYVLGTVHSLPQHVASTLLDDSRAGATYVLPNIAA